MIGYKMTRVDCSGWMYMGTTPREVADTLFNELEMHEGLTVEECGEIAIVGYETTQEEIDALPEFQGW